MRVAYQSPTLPNVYLWKRRSSRQLKVNGVEMEHPLAGITEKIDKDCITQKWNFAKRCSVFISLRQKV
jgi:hypothetical protein